MTARISGMIAQPMKPELAQLTSFWNGKKVFVKVEAPNVVPPESGYHNWASIIGHTLPADGYMVLDDNLEAASILQVATGKPVISRIIVGGKSEAELERLRDAGIRYGINGFFFAQGATSTGASIERALSLFNATEQKPILGSSPIMPSGNISTKQAVESLAERVQSGCSLLVLSPWIHPAESTALIENYTKQIASLKSTVYQGLCPLRDNTQWQLLKDSGITLSREVVSQIDKASDLPDFPTRSLEIEKETLEKPWHSIVRGVCIDPTMFPDQEMESVMNRLRKI